MGKTQGFTLVEIMIVMLIIGVLALMATPAFVKARARSREKVCINNLRQIAGAKEEWAMENSIPGGASCDEDAVNGYIKGDPPDCPASPVSTGDYTYGNIGTVSVPAYPTCNSGVASHAL